MSELPLNDKPPRVPLESKEVVHIIDVLHGMMRAQDSVKKIDVAMPGIKFALCAIDAEIANTRISLFARMTVEAVRAGVDLSIWCVTGIKYDKKTTVIDFKSLESIDRENAN
jgi:hypothetical protein